MYRKNFFGDIVAIYQGATKIAEYSYDAWGNCTIVSDSNGYGARNPFRYRGYYFDSDLNMYYLTTRYYDPHTGRFINADSIEYLKPDAINGLNLYAYCKNNPVMSVDPYGHEPVTFSIAAYIIGEVAIAALLIAAAAVVAAALIYIGNAYEEAKEKEEAEKPPLPDNDRPIGEKPQFIPPKENPLFPDVEITVPDGIVEIINQGLINVATNVFGGPGISNIAAKMFDTEDWLDRGWQ